MAGALWAKRGEHDVSHGARHERAIFLFPSSRASRSCRAPREISRSPRLAHKVPVMQAKGLGKLGNIVAETLLRMQMFPSLAARETCVAETNFAARKTKNVFVWSQKHFCFPDTNFASETYVSQFGHPGKHNKKHCFRNNVS